MAGWPLDAALKLLQSGRDADFSITCGSWSIKVHKLMLSCASDFFVAVCNGNFKEGKEARLNLPEESPYIVARMLSYIYTRSIDSIDRLGLPSEVIEFNDASTQRIFNYIKLHNLADKFNLPELQKNLWHKIQSSSIDDPTDAGIPPFLLKVCQLTGKDSDIRNHIADSYTSALLQSDKEVVWSRFACEVSVTALIGNALIRRLRESNTKVKALQGRVGQLDRDVQYLERVVKEPVMVKYCSYCGDEIDQTPRRLFGKNALSLASCAAGGRVGR